jgi:hypothetical protein
MIAGALFAPILVPMLFLVDLLSGYAQAPGHMQKVAGAVGAVAVYAYVASFIGGIPLVWLLHKVGRLRFGSCVWGAGAIGALEGLATLLMSSGAADWYWIVIAMFSALFATLVAVVFCVVAGIPAKGGATSIRH